MSARTATARLTLRRGTRRCSLRWTACVCSPPVAAQAHRRPDPPQPRAGARVRRDLDAVVISHAHLDHLDGPSLRLIDRSTPVRGAAGRCAASGSRSPRWNRGRSASRRWAVRITATRVRVKAVPADHADSPADGRGGQRARLRRRGGLTAYFAGDTGLYDGMADVFAATSTWRCCRRWLGRGCQRPLNPLTAANTLHLLRPAVAVPMHWGTLTRRGCRRRSTPLGRVAALVRAVRRAPGSGCGRARRRAGRDDRVHAGG